MAAKRTYWTKLNHDEARLAIDMMDDAEIGRWFRGWLAGAGGNEYDDSKTKAWPVEMRSGFKAGRVSFEDAQIYSEKQRQRVSTRYRNPSAVDGGSTAEGSVSEMPTESLPSNNEQPTTNIQETTNGKPHPPTPQRGERVARSAAPSEEDWVAYCTATWPDWHPTCALETWAYYQSVGWRTKAGPIRDWKAAARNAYGNARQWGKLQPGQNHRPGGGPPRPAARASSDQRWIEQNAGRLKPITASDGANNEPAW